MTFPERLKELRLEKGLTQKDIAEELGISQPAYLSWEKGKRKPSAETLEKFSNYFKVSLDYLMGMTDCRLVPQKEDCELGMLFESVVENMTEEEKFLFVQEIADFMKKRLV